MLYLRVFRVLLTLLLAALVVGCDGERVRREAADGASEQSVMEGSIGKAGTKKTAARWREVLALRNKKNVKTKTFKIAGSEWKIRWKTKPKKGQETEEFLVVLYDKKNKDVNEIIANDMGEVEDFLYLDGKGDYYLEVTTNMPYELVVEERKPAPKPAAKPAPKPTADAAE